MHGKRAGPRDTLNGTGVTNDCTHVQRAYRIPTEADTYAIPYTGCPSFIAILRGRLIFDGPIDLPQLPGLGSLLAILLLDTSLLYQIHLPFPL